MRIILALMMASFSFSSFAYLSALPSSVDFGTIEQDSYQRTRTITVRNNSNEAASVRVHQSCFGNFWVTDSCFSDLSPHGSCTITVRYRPRRVGSDSCNIRVHSNSGSSLSLYARGRVREKR